MTLGNGVYALCQWGMLVTLAKLGSPETVGRFALAAAVTAPVMLITNMQLRGVQATDARKEYFLSDYLAVRAASLVLALAVILPILFTCRFDRTAFWATLILALAKSCESISDVFYGFFQQHEKMSIMARSMIARGALSVCVLGAAFYFSHDLLWALAGLTGAWLAAVLFYDAFHARRLVRTAEGESRGALIASLTSSLADRREKLVRIAVLAFPLGIVTGIVALNSNLPRLLIEKYRGTRELGIFAALAYTIVAVNMFVLALGQAVAPPMARFFAGGDFKAFLGILKKMIFVNLGIGLAAVAVILAAGKPILMLIYGPEYAEHTRLFLILMISAGLTGISSALGYALTAARQFNRQVPLSLAVLLSTALLSWWMIPRRGLEGAALALIVSSSIQVSGAAWILAQTIRKAAHGVR